MKQMTLRSMAIIAALLTALTAAIFANEAEKEVRILCSLFTPGKSLEYVERTLATANLLHVQTARANGHHYLDIRSWYNLKLTSCSVIVEDGYVTTSRYRPAPWSR